MPSTEERTGASSSFVLDASCGFLGGWDKFSIVCRQLLNIAFYGDRKCFS